MKYGILMCVGIDSVPKTLKQEGPVRYVGLRACTFVNIRPHLYVWSYIYKYKKEVGCKDDTVPKTVDTRRHCEEE